MALIVWSACGDWIVSWRALDCVQILLFRGSWRSRFAVAQKLRQSLLEIMIAANFKIVVHYNRTLPDPQFVYRIAFIQGNHFCSRIAQAASPSYHVSADRRPLGSNSPKRVVARRLKCTPRTQETAFGDFGVRVQTSETAY
jgi:hypothetical protein